MKDIMKLYFLSVILITSSMCFKVSFKHTKSSSGQSGLGFFKRNSGAGKKTDIFNSFVALNGNNGEAFKVDFVSKETTLAHTFTLTEESPEAINYIYNHNFIPKSGTFDLESDNEINVAGKKLRKFIPFFDGDIHQTDIASEITSSLYPELTDPSSNWRMSISPNNNFMLAWNKGDNMLYRFDSIMNTQNTTFSVPGIQSACFSSSRGIILASATQSVKVFFETNSNVLTEFTFPNVPIGSTEGKILGIEAPHSPLLSIFSPFLIENSYVTLFQANIFVRANLDSQINAMTDPSSTYMETYKQIDPPLLDSDFTKFKLLGQTVYLVALSESHATIVNWQNLEESVNHLDLGDTLIGQIIVIPEEAMIAISTDSYVQFIDYNSIFRCNKVDILLSDCVVGQCSGLTTYTTLDLEDPSTGCQCVEPNFYFNTISETCKSLDFEFEEESDLPDETIQSQSIVVPVKGNQIVSIFAGNTLKIETEDKVTGNFNNDYSVNLMGEASEEFRKMYCNSNDSEAICIGGDKSLFLLNLTSGNSIVKDMSTLTSSPNSKYFHHFSSTPSLEFSLIGCGMKENNGSDDGSCLFKMDWRNLVPTDGHTHFELPISDLTDSSNQFGIQNIISSKQLDGNNLIVLIDEYNFIGGSLEKIGNQGLVLYDWSSGSLSNDKIPKLYSEFELQDSPSPNKWYFSTLTITDSTIYGIKKNSVTNINKLISINISSISTSIRSNENELSILGFCNQEVESIRFDNNVGMIIANCGQEGFALIDLNSKSTVSNAQIISLNSNINPSNSIKQINMISSSHQKTIYLDNHQTQKRIKYYQKNIPEYSIDGKLSGGEPIDSENINTGSNNNPEPSDSFEGPDNSNPQPSIPEPPSNSNPINKPGENPKKIPPISSVKINPDIEDDSSTINSIKQIYYIINNIALILSIPFLHVTNLIQILDSLSFLLRKLNFPRTERLYSLGTFTEKLTLKSLFSSLSNLSPINDGGANQNEMFERHVESTKETHIRNEERILLEDKIQTKYSDAIQYLKLRRGSKGQISTSNGQMFIFSSENFALVIFYLICKSITSLINKFTKQPRKCSIKIVKWIAKLCIKILTIRLVIIAITEVCIHDISKEQSIKFLISYLFSCLIVVIVLYQIYNGFYFLKNMKNKFKCITKDQIKIIDKISSENSPNYQFSGDQILDIKELSQQDREMYFSWYYPMINPLNLIEDSENIFTNYSVFIQNIGNNIVFYSKLRWMIIFVFIISQQLFPIVQAYGILGIQSLFMIQNYSTIFIKSSKIFLSGFLVLKYRIVESALSLIFIILALFTIYKSPEDMLYAFMEILLVTLVFIVLILETFAVLELTVMSLQKWLQDRKGSSLVDPNYENNDLLSTRRLLNSPDSSDKLSFRRFKINKLENEKTTSSLKDVKQQYSSGDEKEDYDAGKTVLSQIKEEEDEDESILGEKTDSIYVGTPHTPNVFQSSRILTQQRKYINPMMGGISKGFSFQKMSSFQQDESNTQSLKNIQPFLKKHNSMIIQQKQTNFASDKEVNISPFEEIKSESEISSSREGLDDLTMTEIDQLTSENGFSMVKKNTQMDEEMSYTTTHSININGDYYENKEDFIPGDKNKSKSEVEVQIESNLKVKDEIQQLENQNQIIINSELDKIPENYNNRKITELDSNQHIENIDDNAVECSNSIIRSEDMEEDPQSTESILNQNKSNEKSITHQHKYEAKQNNEPENQSFESIYSFDDI